MSKRKAKPADPLAEFIAAAKVVARGLRFAVAGGIATPEQVALVKAYNALLVAKLVAQANGGAA